MSYLVIGAVALLGVVFGVSATSKLRAGRDFAASLRGLPLLPERWVRPVAATLTASETLLALGSAATVIALVARSAGRPVALAVLLIAGALLLVLCAGIALAIRQGTGGNCACFGATGRPLGRRHLVRNGLLLLGVVLGLAGLGDGHHVQVAGGLIAVCAGALVAAVLIHLDDLVELFAASPTPASTTPARR
jgi:hypothetical protein